MKLIGIIFLFSLSACNNVENKKEYTAEEQVRIEEIKDSLMRDIDKSITDKNINAAKESPVKITKYWLTYNSIRVPEANVTFKNESNKTVDGIKVSIACYNNFDEPVEKGILGNEFNGISQEKIKAGKTNTTTWTMNLMQTATKIKPYVFHVHYTDGTEWKIK